MSKSIDIETVKSVILFKFEQKRTHRTIASRLKISPATVSYICQRFNRTLNWPIPDDMSDKQLFDTLYPNKRNMCVQPDYPSVEIELRKKGVTKLLLWEEYQQKHTGDLLGYSQFCDNYRAWKGRQKRSMRMTHKAGEKVFIDYCGPTLSIVNPNTGECREVQVFVAVLGASNYTFAIATEDQKLESWLSAHVAMFNFFGGVPELLVPDNLKAGVSKACRYEPILNASYQSLANHYGCAVMPTRPIKPQDKAKAENAVLIVERWIMARLRHEVFHTLASVNTAIKALLDTLNTKPFQRLPGHRAKLFATLDKPALRPLPLSEYEYTDIHRAKVGIDYHVLYKTHFYSAPHTFAGQVVEVHATQRLIKIYHQRECIAQHVRSYRKGGFTCIDEHMPTHHQHQKWSPKRLKSWAKQIGHNTLTVTTAILESKSHPEQGYRACLGLLNLAKMYGNARLELACQRAVDIGNPCRASVKSLLQNRLDNVPMEDEIDTPNLTHHNLRGPHYYK